MTSAHVALLASFRRAFLLHSVARSPFASSSPFGNCRFASALAQNARNTDPTIDPVNQIINNDIGSTPLGADGPLLLRARILEATSSVPLISSSDGEETEPSVMASRKGSKASRRMKVELVDGSIPLEQLLKSKIARRHSTSSFNIVNLGVLADQYMKWRTHMPSVTPFYAVKCNPDIMIVRSLLAMGCGLDVASKTEMRLALGAGCLPQNIIFANPCKSPEALQYANKTGIQKMTFDNPLELSKIKKHFGTHAQPVLRILGDDSFSQMAFGSKFGATPKESIQLLEMAADLGFDIEGISFHVGSGCSSPHAYLNTFERVAQIRQKGQALGHSMRLIDIGGGWPGVDTPELNFPTISEGLNARLLDLFPQNEVNLISEPGRYFAAGTTTLTTCVISRRDRAASPDVSIVERDTPVSHGAHTPSSRVEEAVADDRAVAYYVSDGVYGSFNNIFFDHALPIPKFFKNSSSSAVARYRSTVYGPTCDSIDVLMKDVVLPSLNAGDWLYFPEMGAYTCAAASTFNGFLKPNSFYVMTH
ncbi:MAG: type III PLP-dependent enzyme [archaeon]|nr:type III PLP-dependent enzyme [archaeon]